MRSGIGPSAKHRPSLWVVKGGKCVPEMYITIYDAGCGTVLMETTFHGDGCGGDYTNTVGSATRSISRGSTRKFIQFSPSSFQEPTKGYVRNIHSNPRQISCNCNGSMDE